MCVGGGGGGGTQDFDLVLLMATFCSDYAHVVFEYRLLRIISTIVPPSITRGPQNQTSNETSEVSFFCEASGQPPPNITWTVDGMVVGYGSPLTFPTYRNQSGSRYQCTADNGVGSPQNASAYLTVQSKFICLSLTLCTVSELYLFN